MRREIANPDINPSAREMERVIDRLLVQPLGKALLAGHFAEGTTARVDAHNGELVLEDADVCVRSKPNRYEEGKS